MPSNAASLHFDAGPLPRRPRAGPRRAAHVARDARLPRRRRLRRDPRGLGTDSNAVVHARSSAAIVGSLDDGRLRIEVHDDDPTRPQLKDTPGADGGWGLRIVDDIADGWGWAPTPDRQVRVERATLLRPAAVLLA